MIQKILHNPTGFLLIVVVGFASFYSIYRYIVGKGEDIYEKWKWRWTALEAVTVTVTIFFWSEILASIPLVVLFGEKVIRQETVFMRFITAFVIDAITIGLVYIFLRRRQATRADIGLKRPHLIDIWYVFAGYVVYFVTFWWASDEILKKLLGLNIDQKQEIGFATGITGPSLWLVFVSLVILPPITEEIIMRGFLYKGLRSKFTMLQAGLITSLLFATAHLQFGSGNALLWAAGMDTFILSMVLVHLREKTGRLAAPMGLHALKNFIAFAALFLVKTR